VETKWANLDARRTVQLLDDAGIIVERADNPQAHMNALSWLDDMGIAIEEFPTKSTKILPKNNVA
jgi:hypothetical protein